MKTNYAQAWNEFIESQEHTRCVNEMMKHGMKQPYIDNILRIAFDDGWNASGVKIVVIEPIKPTI